MTEQVHLGGSGLIIQLKLHTKIHTETHSWWQLCKCDEHRKFWLYPSVTGW